jgi:hypothetical protein
LIEAVLMPANQRGQRAGLILGGSSIACDSARDSVAWRMREASGAPGRVTAGGLERSSANFAARIWHQLDARDASSANSASGFIGQWRSARGAFGWIKEVENRRKLLRKLLGERGHI